ncbi:MAG: F0F1 ATP synthase subunit A [Pseudomonadota bacterium]|nr:F0F1 ATP synthase subunit A [Pseudomonadota bacterium]
MATKDLNSGEKHSPLEQFEIKELVPVEIAGNDISFTNSALMMVIAVGLILLLMIVGTRKRAMIPGRLQALAELSYEFVANLIRDTVGSEGRRYFPFIFALFMFILFGNMLGMLPYSFTFTSHIAVTFAMALVVFIGVTILGFCKHGIRFFTFFVPPGVPFWMWPLMIPIEIISYLSRPVSLAMRLFANMLAGHTLLKVFAGFVPALGAAGILPLAFVGALTGLELLIAFLQAYVFAILTCLYINDALHLH